MILFLIYILSFFEFLEIKNNSENNADLIIKVAKSQLGTPYVGGTLDTGLTEKCVVNYEGLDCVTFVENTLAISKSLLNSEINENNFEENIINNITNTRYRNGLINGYLSRLHYTGDWILDNIKKNNITEITQKIGGIKLDNKINFMSTHTEYYMQLKENPDLINGIKRVENYLNKSDLYYIPKEKINKKGINSGDIICIATNIKGLDYSHLGFALIEDNKLKLIHASSNKKKVVIEDDLKAYLISVKNHKGITVLRPNL